MGYLPVSWSGLRKLCHRSEVARATVEGGVGGHSVFPTDPP